MLTTRRPQARPIRSRPTLRGRTQPGQGIAEEPPPPRFEAKAKQRELLNLLRVANATQHLDHLPGPGCAIHAIMRGNYSYADLIPAVLKLAAPAKLDYLAATTLGFSQKAALQLIDLVDSGNVRTVDLICADFFAKADPGVCQFAREELTRRGSRFAAARCHAKIILMGMDDDARYVSESSANIRACRSIEQFALTNDPELYEFHRGWIGELME
jgi:hypothetical protein